MATSNSAYNPSTDSCCGKLVLAINKMTADPTRNKPSVGILQALEYSTQVSDVNFELAPNIEGYTGTSFKTVYTKSIKPSCEEGDDADDVCATPVTTGVFEKSPWITAKHTIDNSIKREIPMDLKEFAKFCDSPEDYLANRLQAMQAGVMLEINKKLTTSVKAMMGAYWYQTGAATSMSAGLAESVSLLTASTLNGGGYVLHNAGYARIQEHYSELNYPYISPIIVGGVHVNSLLGMTGINAPYQNIFSDNNIDPSFADGVNHLLTWAPGTFVLKTVNAITPELASKTIPNKFERTIINNPFGEGLDWDYYLDVSDSGCEYVIKLQLHFDALCPVPYDMVCTKKPALHFLSSCEPMDCSQISRIEA